MQAVSLAVLRALPLSTACYSNHGCDKLLGHSELDLCWAARQLGTAAGPASAKNAQHTNTVCQAGDR